MDRNLQATLADEAPGILSWIIRGAVAWQEHGLEPVPDCVRTAVDEYQLDSDRLGDFFRERCVFDAEATARAADLYKVYGWWADENNLKAKERLSSTAFGRQLAQRFEKTHTREGKVYSGVRLL